MTEQDLPTITSSHSKKMRVLIFGLALLILLLTLFMLAIKQVALRPNNNDLLTGTILPAPRHISEFNLVSEAGAPFTLANLRGHWTVLFAGYTSCPEACPTTLAILKSVSGRLGDDAKRLSVLFLSVDPEHDTPEHLASYIHHFDPDFHAVTGSDQQLEALISNLTLVAFKETDAENDHYEISHSPQLILINPDGDIAAYLESVRIFV